MLVEVEVAGIELRNAFQPAAVEDRQSPVLEFDQFPAAKLLDRAINVDDGKSQALGQLTLRLALAPHFAGDLRDDEALACLYSGARLYVHPALTEGFGLPPLEAMKCGTPVLCSGGGALPETVGDAAALLPPADPERWAAEIEALLGDEARRADLVRRGLARAATFTWDKAAARTLEVYEQALRSGA